VVRPENCYVVCLDQPGVSHLGCLLGEHYCVEHDTKFISPGYCPEGRGAERIQEEAAARADRLREVCDL
jgi:hypothetical protein